MSQPQRRAGRRMTALAGEYRAPEPAQARSPASAPGRAGVAARPTGRVVDPAAIKGAQSAGPRRRPGGAREAEDRSPGLTQRQSRCSTTCGSHRVLDRDGTTSELGGQRGAARRRARTRARPAPGRRAADPTRSRAARRTPSTAPSHTRNRSARTRPRDARRRAPLTRGRSWVDDARRCGGHRHHRAARAWGAVCATPKSWKADGQLAGGPPSRTTSTTARRHLVMPKRWRGRVAADPDSQAPEIGDRRGSTALRAHAQLWAFLRQGRARRSGRTPTRGDDAAGCRAAPSIAGSPYPRLCAARPWILGDRGRVQKA